MELKILRATIDIYDGFIKMVFEHLISMTVFIKTILEHLISMTIFIKSSLKRFNYLQKYHHVLKDDGFGKIVLYPMLLKISFVAVNTIGQTTAKISEKGHHQQNHNASIMSYGYAYSIIDLFFL